jgi:hypothetical protein
MTELTVTAMIKRLVIIIIAMLALFVGTAPATERQNHGTSAAGAQQLPDFRDVRVPDSKKQIRRLSRTLGLKTSQKKGLLAMLSDRDRDIELIQQSEVLSKEAKASRIAAIVSESNEHIEDVLNGKQKQKFERVLIRQHERDEKNSQA